MSENYEALGRFHSAQEKAIQASRRRRSSLMSLDRIINAVNGIEVSGMLAADFDAASARTLLDEAIESNAEMLHWVNEANAVAVAAGKSPLSVGLKRSAS